MTILIIIKETKKHELGRNPTLLIRERTYYSLLKNKYKNMNMYSPTIVGVYNELTFFLRAILK